MAAVAGTDTRERILRTTLSLIGGEGLAAVTNRRVAAEADISLGSLTYHFGSQVDLLRESLLLFVGEEVVRLGEIADDIRARRPDLEQAALEVERIVQESANRLQQLAELELHLFAARDPALQEASERCFEAYEGLAAASLEALGVPDARDHARTVIALMYGLGLRRLGTGNEDATGTARALVTVVRGASGG